MSTYYSERHWVYKWDAIAPCAGINVAVRLVIFLSCESVTSYSTTSLLSRILE
jgi:hypothetical protein